MPFPVSEDGREVSQYIRMKERERTVVQSFLSHPVKPGTKGHKNKSWDGEGGKTTKRVKEPQSEPACAPGKLWEKTQMKATDKGS